MSRYRRGNVTLQSMPYRHAGESGRPRRSRAASARAPHPRTDAARRDPSLAYGALRAASAVAVTALRAAALVARLIARALVLIACAAFHGLTAAGELGGRQARRHPQLVPVAIALAFAAVLCVRLVPCAFASADEIRNSMTSPEEGSAAGRVPEGDGGIGDAGAAVATASAFPGSLSRGAHLGVDVSEHNGEIDWQALREQGVEYAIIRCGYGADYGEYDDEQWERNASECERLGIPYGVYLYSYAQSDAGIRSEISHTLRLLDGHRPTLPIYYDLEEPRSLAAFGGDPSAISAQASMWCEAMRGCGYNPGVYSSTSWWEGYLTEFDPAGCSVWVAQYNDACTYAGSYDIWQFSADGGLAGSSDETDMDVMVVGGSPDADARAAVGW